MLPELLEFVKQGKIDPSFVVTHRIPLTQAPHGYDIFREKQRRFKVDRALCRAMLLMRLRRHF